LSHRRLVLHPLEPGPLLVKTAQAPPLCEGVEACGALRGWPLSVRSLELHQFPSSPLVLVALNRLRQWAQASPVVSSAALMRDARGPSQVVEPLAWQRAKAP